jgi:hypothetical protein
MITRTRENDTDRHGEEPQCYQVCSWCVEYVEFRRISCLDEVVQAGYQYAYIKIQEKKKIQEMRSSL